MGLSRITTWPTWSLQLSEINNIMCAVKTLYIWHSDVSFVTMHVSLWSYFISVFVFASHSVQSAACVSVTVHCSVCTTHRCAERYTSPYSIHKFTTLTDEDRGRGTYTAGTVDSVPRLTVTRKKRRFSVSLLMTWRHQIDLPKIIKHWVVHFCCTGRQKCTKLHRFAPMFSRTSPANPSPDPCHRRTSTVPLFHSFCGRWTKKVVVIWLVFQ